MPNAAKADTVSRSGKITGISITMAHRFTSLPLSSHHLIMLFSTACLLLPLLASAAPAGLTVQKPDLDSSVFASLDLVDSDIASSFSVNLDELRLVQLHPDEPAV